ncbi:MAG: hypothetical protein J6T10_27830 [Methanobrevibacter sp.]|nr:hypothetical protein [Methanobrevibacter sp.]
MIRIYNSGETLIATDANYYQLSDIDTLTRTCDNEPFVLVEGLLWEAEEPYSTKRRMHY